MRVTAEFFLYLLICLIGSALLSYPLLATGWIDLEPERLMGRLAQILILLGIWPFLKFQSLADRGSLGFGLPKLALQRAVILGWLQGVAILLLLVMGLLALDIRVPDPDPGPWPWIVSKALQALIGGLLIGLLEETFFRGALFSALRRGSGLVPALVWTSLLYALLHFMKPGELPSGMPFDWSGSAWMFAHVFIDVFQWRNFDSMVALFCVGLFLGLVRERTGHIGWCIGLHAGWVFVIQVARRLTDGNETASLSFLVGDYDGTIGWLAAVWIAGLAALYWLWSGRRLS